MLIDISSLEYLNQTMPQLMNATNSQEQAEQQII